ncbi:MAG TPA: hypothetical protein VFC79_12280 [Tissierellaceae bacterium]|nr:hypothetical protein [Tissierellaceae bacterium]
MSRKVPLEDVFERYCEYTQCIHNYDCHCEYNVDISEFIIYKKGDNHVKCNAFEVKDGYCEECGAKLKEYIERHPYGNTYAEEHLTMCPNCD